MELKTLPIIRENCLKLIADKKIPIYYGDFLRFVVNAEPYDLVLIYFYIIYRCFKDNVNQFIS